MPHFWAFAEKARRTARTKLTVADMLATDPEVSHVSRVWIVSCADVYFRLALFKMASLAGEVRVIEDCLACSSEKWRDLPVFAGSPHARGGEKSNPEALQFLRDRWLDRRDY